MAWFFGILLVLFLLRCPSLLAGAVVVVGGWAALAHLPEPVAGLLGLLALGLLAWALHRAHCMVRGFEDKKPPIA